MSEEEKACKWLPLEEALQAFVLNDTGTEGADHIRPLHWYVACRLVIEGGFMPEEVTPRPPFVVREQGRRRFLEFTGEGGTGERTLLGGLKTKAVDVVVIKDGIGPVFAVSLKGTIKAFRNLTNRMEEAVGDCTNLHIAYPALVYGFLHVLRGNREGQETPSNDIAIRPNGEIVEGIRRYHEVMERLADRDDVRAETSKYEAICLAVVDPVLSPAGRIKTVECFPGADSKLLLRDFFPKLYAQYDLRYVYAAPALVKKTLRCEWDAESPILKDQRIVGYEPRIAHAGDEQE
jgi:hypothetical protein